jgi:hypothetical protein
MREVARMSQRGRANARPDDGDMRVPSLPPRISPPARAFARPPAHAGYAFFLVWSVLSCVERENIGIHSEPALPHPCRGKTLFCRKKIAVTNPPSVRRNDCTSSQCAARLKIDDAE